ncbi:hypothetical protein Gotur_035542 [Gossypium turneri]
MRDDISEEKWMAILQNLREEDVEWRAPWLCPYEILYRCDDFDWVLLLGIWEAVGYAPLLVLRQDSIIISPSQVTKIVSRWRNIYESSLLN